MSEAEMSHPSFARPRNNGLSSAVYGVFMLSIFLSAGLLFMVQPLFGKLTLPLLGGTPNVWNTAMLFFQAALLAGYLYAHAISRLRSLRLQQAIHLGVMAAATLSLPLGISQAWKTPPEGAPTLWLLGLLAVNVGPPFFALSANAPLIQKWFSRTSHAQASDPYFLYAASNLGSFIGLLGYPLVLEPRWTLASQSSAWFAGFITLLFGLCIAAALSQRAAAPIAVSAEQIAQTSAPTARQKLHWIWLSALPSALLLSVTNHITTDIVAMPLLWVVPLALYLLTFTIVFANKPLIPHGVSLRIQPVLLVLVLSTLYIVDGINIFVLGALAIAAFFFTALIAHGELAKQRPDAHYLTQFYIFMSLGGVIGGSAIALGAPLVFDSILEYPILMVLAALIRPASQKIAAVDYVLPIGLAAAIVACEMSFDLAYLNQPAAMAIFITVLTCAIQSHQARLRLFGLTCVAAGFGYALGLGAQTDTTIHQTRTFFGVHSVRQDEAQTATKLYHGTTLHGMQFTSPGKAREPLLYYDRAAGMGRFFAAANAYKDVNTVGVVGLGAGAAACYAQPGQSWTYFEIDPQVAQIAQDPGYFTYLQRCTPDINIVLGDARLTLEKQPDRQFDILVIDAFSSDAIPLHLLTQQAAMLYETKLRDDGYLLLHISNRYLDLEPAIAALAQAQGLSARIFDYKPAMRPLPAHKSPSSWVLLTRDTAFLNTLTPQQKIADRSAHSAWRPLELRPDFRVWSDDFSNIFDVLK